MPAEGEIFFWSTATRVLLRVGVLGYGAAWRVGLGVLFGVMISGVDLG